jgi:hypothetical protein
MERKVAGAIARGLMRKHKNTPPVVACKNNVCNWVGRINGQGRRARCPRCQQILFPLTTDGPSFKT